MHAPIQVISKCLYSLLNIGKADVYADDICKSTFNDT